MGLDELHALVWERVAGVFASPQAVYGAMRMTDCEPRLVPRAVIRHNRVTDMVKTDPVVLLPAAEALRAWIGMWEGLSGANAARWGARAMVRAAAARTLLDDLSSGGVLVELTVPELMRRLRAIDPQVGALDAGFLRKTAIAAGVGARRGFAEVRVPLPQSHAASVTVLEYPAAQAVFALALRLSQQAGEQPSLEPGEQVLSTNELLGAGLRTSKGQAVFAIRLPKAIEGPEAELPVAPYTLGAWLGDGSSGFGSIASMDDEIVDLVEADGYPLRSIWHDRGRSAGRVSLFRFQGLFAALRTVLEFDPDASYRKLDKRIPAVYLRASRAQRLALLQGLMDTDGTISSRSGGCEITLSKPDLAADVLELVRSLGIKASMTVGAAGYRDTDGNQVVCRPRHRIKFTTALEVFRLARKRALLPTQVRRTQEWLYITSIDPVLPGDPDYEPARCISVDSPDHTYLLAGFVPTHNSVLMSWLGDQFARIPNARGERTPVVIFDPKALALDTKVWTPTGHTTVGEVAVGDLVIGGDGRPCRVIAKSPVFPAGESQMYEVAFDEGQTVRADSRHRWLVLTSRQRAAAAGADERQIAERLRTRRSDAALLGEIAVSAGHEDVTTGGLFGELCAAGIWTWGNPQSLARDLQFFGAIPTHRKGRGRKQLVWDRREALGAAAERASRLVDHPFGEVLTTGELVRRGLTNALDGGGLEFATEVPGPAQCLEGLVSSRDCYQYIRSITPSAPEPAQCLTVDSPDHTFVVADGIRTHNTHSDFSGVVRLSGGTTYSLDELSTADGVFDPLRFSHVPAVGIEGAHATLMAVNPWGTVDERARWETPLLKALNYGVAQGARSTMRALVVAERDGVAARALVDPVRDVMEASPMFSALCGSDDSGQALRAAEGITYIKVGKNSLNLPAPGTAVEDLSIPQKVTLQLVRNIVYGAMSALNGRQGVIMLDEAWVFTSAGRTEMERVGRLARSQQVFPMLFTQRVTDALNADLAGYISRGVILPITDVNEATAACTLFNLEPTPERMARITARQSMGDAGDDSGAPNWRSMRALRDPVTRQVLRGTIGIYADISGRAVPTEIRIPPGFLAAASTNRLDMQDRAREAARAAETDQLAAQATAFAPADAEQEPVQVQRLRGMESGW